MNSDIVKNINELMLKFPDKESALLPALSLIQNEKGHVSEKDMEELACIMDLPEARIFSTASFYTMLNLKPAGKYNIQVCNNIVCSLLNPDSLLEYISQSLSIRAGETTQDGLFSLTAVECIASCGNAPAMMINLDRYENMSFKDIDQIIALIRENERGN